MSRAVLFDLDGTLCDPRLGITRSLRHALRRLGREPPPAAELTRYIGPPLRDAFGELLPGGDPALIERAVGYYRERFAERGLYENTLCPEIETALAELRRRELKLFVATSKPAVYARRIVDHFGIGGYFREVYGSELDGRRGDKGELLAHLLACERLTASTTVMVGDREHDARGAAANGIAAVGVSWGFGSPEELRAAGVAYLCDSPRALVSCPAFKHRE